MRFFIYPIVWYNRRMNNKELTGFYTLVKESFVHFRKIKSNVFKVFGLMLSGMLIFQYIFEYNSISDNYLMDIILSLLYVAYMVFSLILVIGFTASLKKKKEVSLRRIIKRGNKLLIPSIWASMIVLMVQIGGFSLFIIPGIILSIYLVFSRIAVIIDSKKGFESLLYSFNLVRGYWWPIFSKFITAILTVTGLIILSFMGLSLIFSLIYMIMPNLMLYLALTDFIISLITVLFITPMFLIFLYTLYEDLKTKDRVEGKMRSKEIINIAAIVGSIITIIYSVLLIISN